MPDPGGELNGARSEHVWQLDASPSLFAAQPKSSA